MHVILRGICLAMYVESITKSHRIHTMNLHSQLDHYLTQWDIKQSTKRGYNTFALGIYLERAADLASDVAQGATISDAIDVHFCDRIAAMLHKKFS